MSNILEQLLAATDAASQASGAAKATPARIDDALAGAIDPQRLIDSCAEAWRVSASQAQSLLAKHGLGRILTRLRPAAQAASDEATSPPLAASEVLDLANGLIRIRAMSPAFNDPTTAAAPILESVAVSITAFMAQSADDPLGVLYRSAPADYANKWLRDEASQIQAYMGRHFAGGRPRYVVNSGIGANEQFNYLVARLANMRTGAYPSWLLANSPKELASLPTDACVANTLFLEFSRSGITEETVKLHEFTPREAKRVVFANTGPLRSLAERDQNLLLRLPDEVSGRYGRNKTPILMAPMFAVGLNVSDYWKQIQSACDGMDLGRRDSAPVVIAQWLRIQQLRRQANHIYLGTNDTLLQCSADELCQYWNEGVNRDGNDISMSRYLGLPRDSHMNLEAILGTSERKLAIFLLNAGPRPIRHALAQAIDPIRPEHAGLSASEVDLILALANAKRCSEKMPTLLITVNGVDLVASAWLGQLWADITLAYSRLIGVDPGSNPEVKNVRTRAAEWLADKGRAFELLK